MTLRVWHIERLDDGGYDTYSDAVVIAEDELDAKLIHPGNEYYRGNGKTWQELSDKQREQYGTHLVYAWVNKNGRPDVYCSDWIHPESVRATYLGDARRDLEEGTVICASYHAG